ncbi:phosphonate ABC transporter permease [Dolosicoccus paucivorans]|uniref:Phosphonate ABC transporter permease n=1 Tax=Dolosicoccus paucivorans TaxID=84521 RepID=A0A2N6SQ05_9LACT|nr:ABC transporter permease subunit [Dolosicoccus paucivorans]PMB84557.1 phosphonate ABC transporter permease [Dolosicoccus paucivorans]PMC59148.1 phosphonate ABC transporter permease [Dolosicoccus paucivorans]
MNLSVKYPRLIVSFILFSCVILNFWSIDWPTPLMNPGGKVLLMKMWQGLIHLDITKSTLMTGLHGLWVTLSYALAAISLSSLLALVLSFLASNLWGAHPLLAQLTWMVIRGLRVVHELVWAWLFVTSIGLTPWSGILALTLPYTGYLAKIYTELLQEVPQSTIETLKTCGANPLQIFFYGYLPLAFPEMLSYTMYRLECAIRSSSVLSFVGLGGIGFHIQLALQDMRFNEVWTYLLLLTLLIWLIDQWGHAIRTVSI